MADYTDTAIALICLGLDPGLASYIFGDKSCSADFGTAVNALLIFTSIIFNIFRSRYREIYEKKDNQFL